MEVSLHSSSLMRHVVFLRWLYGSPFRWWFHETTDAEDQRTTENWTLWRRCISIFLVQYAQWLSTAWTQASLAIDIATYELGPTTVLSFMLITIFLLQNPLEKSFGPLLCVALFQVTPPNHTTTEDTWNIAPVRDDSEDCCSNKIGWYTYMLTWISPPMVGRGFLQATLIDWIYTFRLSRKINCCGWEDHYTQRRGHRQVFFHGHTLSPTPIG